MPQDPRRHLAGSIAVIKAAVFEAREPELIPSGATLASEMGQNR
jgi:hypothetical protein